MSHPARHHEEPRHGVDGPTPDHGHTTHAHEHDSTGQAPTKTGPTPGELQQEQKRQKGQSGKSGAKS